MFEEMDYESILNRMLDRIPDTIDKREGSIIYDALAPAAAELAQMYINLESSIDLVFVDTASDEYLDRLCNQIGIYRNQATNAVKKGIFYDNNKNTMDINIGSRFTCEDTYWKVVEKIDKGTYRMECETDGTNGNNITGKLVPIEYIPNLNYGELTELLIPGENTETDEALRKRYIDRSNSIAFGGNVIDYQQKTNLIEGVGATHVIPVWNGGGTVKLVILDSNYNKASEYLVKTVQNEICPNLTDTGTGIAPIGHSVTVDTVTEKTINISSKITLSESGELESTREKIKEELEKYFLNLRKTWEDSTSLIVRKSQIETTILSIDSIIDISETKLNDADSNIEVSIQSIPVLGEVNIIV